MERKEVSNIFQKEIEGLISPWLRVPNLDGAELPKIQIIELARASGQDASIVLRWVNKSEPKISIGNKNYRITTNYQPLPEKTTEVIPILKRNNIGQLVKGKLKIQKQVEYPLSKTRELNLNPQRIIRSSRYESRAPGGGPVQKAGFQQQRVSSQILTRAKERACIRFVDIDKPVIDTIQVVDELQTSFPPNNNKFESAVFQLERCPEIKQVCGKLSSLGERGKLVLRRNEEGLVKSLSRFADGEDTDFLIWNCIGFQWTKNWQDSVPCCEIVENTSESIALYYLDRISNLSKILSPLGKATFTILLPSNEVFDESYTRFGLYSQTKEKRENILTETKKKILNGLQDKNPTLSKHIRVLTWDEYLKEKSISATAEEYSKRGRERLTNSPNFGKIQDEMLRSAKNRFSKIGITTLDAKTLLAIQEAYYSIYAGEGVAFEELAESGGNIVVFNFEEMRVPQLEYLGAQGNITILTPIKNREMEDFYDWKNNRISKRYEKIKSEGKKT